MTEPPRLKRGREARPQNSLPAVLSALVVVAVLAVLIVMLVSNRSGGSQTAAAPTDTSFFAVPTSAAAAGSTTAVGVPTPVAAQGQPKTYSAPPPMTIDPNKKYTATITTPRGDIVVRLRPDLAPQTVNSFVFLSKEGFYNGVTWHRVLPGFMAQGGDPTGTGMGGPGYTIPAEFTDKVLFDRPGIMAMARPGNDINGNGSQFFITTAPAPNLNQQYTIFGEVEQGQEIVNGIPLRDPDQNPATPGEQIVKITIAEQ